MVVTSFPPVEEANEDGLVAIGGDLEISSLLHSYSNGIFPWPISKDFPLAWFSPDPRGVLEYSNLHISSSLKKLIKSERFKIKFNTNFIEVINNCAKVKNRKGQTSTWITQDIIDAYIHLHNAGYAYSVETYLNNHLVGGVYGVCIGNLISGESMYYDESNASKVALVCLMEHLNSNGIGWIDTQMITPVVQNLGGKNIPRSEFMKKVKSRKHLSMKSIF